MIRLFNTDNMDFMRSVPDGFYDLAITDPPYGIGISSNPVRQMHDKKQWDNAIPNDEYFKELFRISKNQIIWGGNYFLLPPSQGFVIWDKKQPEDFSMAMCEFAWSSIQSPAKIWRYSVLTERDKIHPTQKPVALYKWLLKNYAKEGDKIFDSHGGSLSIAIACGEMGYDLDACELDQDYFKDSVARVQRHFTQSNAFMKTPEILVNPLFGK
jgi:site-specific DNA-methyltransferase (adenine-specific)